MACIFNIFISLCLIIFQTAIIANFSFFDQYFDVLIVYVIFLGFFRSFAECLPVVFLLGIVMDSLAGGPFGMYLTTYFWLFMGARWIKQFLHAGSLVLLPFFVISGVLFENFLFVVTLALTTPECDVFSPFPDSLSTQLLWALLTGPFIYFFIHQVYKKRDQWSYQILGRRSKHDG